MQTFSRILPALTLAWLLWHSIAGAADLGRPTCPPGHSMVEETVLKEVVKHSCKYVTEMKKVRKTVYEYKEEPYCLAQCSLFGHKPGCGDCNTCEPPRTRKILVKREIVEEVPVCRCVVETVRETIPVKVYRPAPHCVTPIGAPR